MEGLEKIIGEAVIYLHIVGLPFVTYQLIKSRKSNLKPLIYTALITQGPLLIYDVYAYGKLIYENFIK